MMNLRNIDLSETDYWVQVAALRRPQLLIRAARHGLADYRRERDLRRVLGTAAPPAPRRALPLLLAEEERINELRRTDDAGYDAHRHILTLVALLGELQEMPRPVPHLFVVADAVTTTR